MKAFRTIIAFFQAILPLLGLGLISAITYSELESPYNVIVAISIVILGLYLSRSLFNFMRRRGVIDTISGSHSSYELDDLEPTPDSGVHKLTPNELANLFLDNTINFGKGTTVSIWGDWEGRELNVRHLINSVDFNSGSDTLTIKFSDNYLLKIKSPELILCSSSYLKVMEAQEVLWQTPIDANSNNLYHYLNTGKEIQTKSNTTWKPHAYDIGLGMNALYLQG